MTTFFCHFLLSLVLLLKYFYKVFLSIFAVIIAGTNLTQQELDDRVTSQLMEHKLLLDEKETEKGTAKEKTEKCSKKEESSSFAGVTKSKIETKTEANTFCTEEDLDAELKLRLEQRRKELEEEWRLEQAVIQRQLERERLLKKRGTQEENTLKKSVSFQDEESSKVKIELIKHFLLFLF